MNFRSDNEAPVNPIIMQAIIDANQGYDESYGYDKYSEALTEEFKQLFGCWCEVIPLATGTAANSLAIALAAPPYGSAFCFHRSHLNADECGAPEFFSDGVKLIGIDGENGKIDLDKLENTLANSGVHGEHECLPSVISITQSTEAGTIYSSEEMDRLLEIKNKYGLYLHIDGARIANAVAALNQPIAEMTWKKGVDLLSFGATKNGAMMAEALVIFNPKIIGDIKRRRKRAGHLISKMRYVSAQLLAYLKDDLWLNLANHANSQAQYFYESLKNSHKFVYPVQANEAFLQLPVSVISELRARGFEFHIWPGSNDIIRLVFSHSTKKEDVTNLINTIVNLCK